MFVRGRLLCLSAPSVWLCPVCCVACAHLSGVVGRVQRSVRQDKRLHGRAGSVGGSTPVRVGRVPRYALRYGQKASPQIDHSPHYPQTTALCSCRAANKAQTNQTELRRSNAKKSSHHARASRYLLQGSNARTRPANKA